MRAWELFEELNWAVGPNINHAYGAIKNDLNDPDYMVVWVDIKDLFDKTYSQQRLNVDDPTGGENSIGNRVERAKEFWHKGGYMNPSLVSWNDYCKCFDFSDGRHRLVAAYQMGERWAPIVIDKESTGKLKELVKTK